MDWKSDFDKKFLHFGSFPCENGQSCLVEPEEVKSFIENLIEQEKKRIMSLPCMEEEKLVGDLSDVLTASRNFLRRELKEAIINKK